MWLTEAWIERGVMQVAPAARPGSGRGRSFAEGVTEVCAGPAYPPQSTRTGPAVVVQESEGCGGHRRRQFLANGAHLRRRLREKFRRGCGPESEQRLGARLGVKVGLRQGVARMELQRSGVATSVQRCGTAGLHCCGG